MPSSACVAPSSSAVVRGGRRAADHLEVPSVRVQEAPAASGRGLDPDLSLVHQAVVQAAQGHEVGEFGLPAVGPVLDVMRIDIALVGAAGEAAAAVAGRERAADRGRNAARLAPHIERLALLVLEHAQQARIAGEPAHGLGGERGPLLDLAAPGAVLVQSLGIHVHDDLIAIGASLELTDSRLPARKLSATAASASARRAGIGDRPLFDHVGGDLALSGRLSRAASSALISIAPATAGRRALSTRLPSSAYQYSRCDSRAAALLATALRLPAPGGSRCTKRST